ncbi:MAG: choice-of-anchor Q domain-containing protein, partial [Verrucomicrobiales bacterium]
MERMIPVGWKSQILASLLAWSLVGVAGAARHTVSNTGDSGAGSLRNTLGSAIAGDEIDFDESLDGMAITLTSGELLIDKHLVVDASNLNRGIEISGDETTRVLRVVPSVVATLKNLRILNGRAPAPENGGGIFNEGELTLEGCTLSNNLSGSSLEAFGKGGGGGAIYNSVKLTVVDSTIANNRAPSAGGGIWNAGSGNCRIERSTVSGNLAGIANHGMSDASGGGIYSLGELEVVGSVIVENRADATTGSDFVADPERGGAGGGIYSEGSCHVIGSEISGNVAGEGLGTARLGGQGGHGGGIYCGGTLTVTTSLISRNRAGKGGRGASAGDGGGGSGGGIYAVGPCTITRSALCENISGLGGAYGFSPIRSGHGGGIVARETLVMENSSVLANSASPDLHIDSVGGDGGGVYCTKSAILTHCTIAFNRTTDGRFTFGGGIAMASGAQNLEMAACVVAGNLANDHPDLSLASPLIEVVRRGLNFVGEATDVAGFPTGFISGDPMLSLPGDFGGGLTAAMPLTGSPLIDSANLSAPGGLAIDQRGQMRNVPDIGAIERVASDSRFDRGIEDIGVLTITYAIDSTDLSVQRGLIQ